MNILEFGSGKVLVGEGSYNGGLAFSLEKAFPAGRIGDTLSGSPSPSATILLFPTMASFDNFIRGLQVYAANYAGNTLAGGEE